MITVEGLNVLRARVAALTGDFPENAEAALLKHVTVEVRSREQIGWRQPLDVKGDGLTVAIIWPYPYEGGVGTYVTRIADAACAVMIDGLTRTLSDDIQGSL